jgi:hypothetical protein
MKLLTDTAPDDLLRNKLGFRRMMAIEHPNLLRVDRIYQLGTCIALAMEEIDGITLTEAVQGFQATEPALAYQRLLSLLRDYASGLAMMHAHGYIHRDLKPDNLMVDRKGRGRVIDYGLVDAFELEQSAFGARGFLLGTPHYFAPEVIWSQRYLPAGDIFSLGIVTLDALHEIQTHRGPRQAELQRSNESQHDDAERIVDAIDDLSDSVPEVILEACREMLERHPADRPTAMELVRLGLPHSQPVQWPHEEPIIGRDAERREIVAWVEEIFCGNVGRLHVTGPSGIGKSRLMEQVVEHIESKNWGQVFSAKCRSREDQPLQAFDQICDAIAHRYMKGDRERLELDAVSASMLKTIFPVLENVFASSPPTLVGGSNVEPLDALEAAARMSDQLRLVGPLFLVIDDAQWADRDSLNVLDRLQTAVGREGLGIITVSREPDDPQRLRASKYIHLGPIDVDSAVTILRRAAQRWDVDVPAEMICELAEASGGSPFRLRELADEFRPGGVLSEFALSQQFETQPPLLSQVSELWKRRVGRLSDDAKKVLTFVVTAGGQVSTQQLAELTELGNSVDASVSELARQRLINDEATGGECISVFHDHVADELIKHLSVDAMREAHQQWALLLSRQQDAGSLSARIAGHFFNAGKPGRAVAHAILAAEDAERRAAISEAARWYTRVVDYVDGVERASVLSHAARCYDKADFPLPAADCYQRLADLVQGSERIECTFQAIRLLIRGGRFDLARDQISVFAGALGLPKPKLAWRGRIALMTGRLRARLRDRDALLHSVVEMTASESVSVTGGAPATEADASGSPSNRRALKFCDSLIRPMSLFDHLYAEELSLEAIRLALNYGTRAERLHAAITESVFQCVDKGHRRIEGESNLLTLKPHVARLNCSFTSGELWAGIAYSHALACRWNQVALPVQTSLEHYQHLGRSLGFESAHVQWLDVWANWHLGRWTAMRIQTERMLEDGQRRNDLLQQMLSSGGLGSSAFLAIDRPDQLQQFQEFSRELNYHSSLPQLPDVFDWIRSIQLSLYQGKFDEAWHHVELLEPKLRRFPVNRIQLFRVTSAMLSALTAIHNLKGDYRDPWRLRAQVRIDRLSQEQSSLTTMLANYFGGLLQSCIARHQRSSSARSEAEQRLTAARDQASMGRLRPFQLAAMDGLIEVRTGRSLGRLDRRMIKQGIVCPRQFRRLYTVADE